MAEIWLARDVEQPDRDIVVKRIHPHLAENEEFVMMFLDEARIAARLAHPGCVQIFDLGREGDSFFIAMEYIHGEDIRSIARQARKKGVPLPRKIAIEIIAGACDGLHYAHDLKDASGRPLNVVHRDVSPQNILVTYDGLVKIVDFGIAKAADQANQTRAGVLKGKYAYMSPEQVMGRPLDRRSDVFALGVLLYELTTGKRLFKAETELETMRRITQGVVRPPTEASPGYPKDLEAIVLKALAKDRDARWPSADALQGALRDFLAAHNATVSSEDLAAFMCALFEERLAAERRAEASGDQEALLDARFGEVKDSVARRLEPLEVDIDVEESQEASIEVAPMPTQHLAERPEEVAGHFTDPGHMPQEAEDAFAEALHPGLGTDPGEGSLTGSFTESSTGQLTGPVAVEATPFSAEGAEPAAQRGASWKGPVTALLLLGAAAAGGTVWYLQQSGGASAASRLEAAPSPISVRVETDPLGAKVVLNGAPQPFTTPATLRDLDPRESYLLLLSKEGYPPEIIHLRGDRLEPGARIFHRFTHRSAGKPTSPKGAKEVAPLDGPGPAGGQARPGEVVPQGSAPKQTDGAAPAPGAPGDSGAAPPKAPLREAALGAVRSPPAPERSVDAKKSGSPRGAIAATAPAPGAPDTKGSNAGPTATATATGGEGARDPPPKATAVPAPRKAPRTAVGYLTLTGDGTARVFIDGRPAGSLPLARHPLKAGRHDVVVKGAEVTRRLKVRIPRGRTLRRSVSVRPGLLKLSIQPWAEVYVDGKRMGTTPIAPLPVAPGRHRVRLVNPDLGVERTVRVQVPAGDAYLLRLDLRKDGR